MLRKMFFSSNKKAHVLLQKGTFYLEKGHFLLRKKGHFSLRKRASLGVGNIGGGASAHGA